MDVVEIDCVSLMERSLLWHLGLDGSDFLGRKISNLAQEIFLKRTFLNTFPCLTVSMRRMGSGLSEENVNCGLIGQLNFTPWLVEEEPLLLLQTRSSTWTVNLTSLETSMPVFSVSHFLSPSANKCFSKS